MAEKLENTEMTLREHLAELRRRVFWVFVALSGSAVLGYVYHRQITDLLLRPLGENESLIYTSPAGGLEFLFKVCLFVGIVAAIPMMVYQLIKFIEPAIYKQTAKSMIVLVGSSTLLALGGAAFGYLVSLPAALNFLTQFNSEQIQALLSTNEYLSFVMLYLAGFALLFQIPLVILFINNNMTPLDPRKLFSYQKFVVVGSFIVAAIITPTPDPMNQFLMAAPAIAQYQVSIFGVWLKNRRRDSTAAAKDMRFKAVECPNELPEAVVEDVSVVQRPAPVQPQPVAISAAAVSPATAAESKAPEQVPAAPASASPATRKSVDGMVRAGASTRPARQQFMPERNQPQVYERKHAASPRRKGLSLDGVLPAQNNGFNQSAWESA